MVLTKMGVAEAKALDADHLTRLMGQLALRPGPNPTATHRQLDG
jgi:hypothetical protein